MHCVNKNEVVVLMSMYYNECTKKSSEHERDLIMEFFRSDKNIRNDTMDFSED